MPTLTFLAAVALVAGSASAQVDEADRLARCQNNRQAISYVESQLRTGGYWSEEQIVQAQATARALVDRMHDFLVTYQILRQEQRDLAPLQNTLVLTQRLQREAIPLLEIVRPFGIVCEDWNVDCAANILSMLVARIDQQVAAQPTRVMAAQAIASYRTNLIALGCDQTSSAAGQLAGTWYVWGVPGEPRFEISQSGPSIGWQIGGIEAGTGTVDGETVSGSVSGSGGTRAVTGTLAWYSGQPVRITWDDGRVFARVSQ